MLQRTSPAPALPVRRGRAAAWLAAIAAAYLALLWYIDRDTGLLAQLAGLAQPLLACALLVFASYLVRYQRWRWLLAAQGHPARDWRGGACAYLAGFAFTASPGKAGELLRIRYFGWQGIPASITLSTFIYERALDLLLITVLAAGAAALVPGFGLLVAVIAALLLMLAVLAVWPAAAQLAGLVAQRLPWAPLRRLAHFMVAGACGLRALLQWRVALPAMLHGAVAWGLTAVAFALLCGAVGISLPWPLALGIYPLAMLIGALSFMPGGVGTTEAAIVLMLTATGVSAQTALTVAIGIRLVSLWQAVVIGMLAALLLEWAGRREAAQRTAG